MSPRPAVHIPAPEADRPSWLRVGLVALVGFAVGVAWPRIAGVRLGPAAPAEAVSAVAAQRAAEAASVAAANAAAAPPPPPPSAAPAAPTVSVAIRRGAVLSCRDEGGDSMKGRECGGLAGLDSLVRARLERLEQAPAAATNPGKLDVVLGLDFKNNRVSVSSGRSSTVKDPQSLKAFVAGEMKGMSLKSVDHDHDRYSVLYVLHITTGDAGAPAATASASSAAAPSLPPGEAAVAWDTAIVRDAPHTGAIVARLPRGTKVKLGPSHGGWYTVEYGAGFASQGFVYRGAIGK